MGSATKISPRAPSCSARAELAELEAGRRRRTGIAARRPVPGHRVRSSRWASRGARGRSARASWTSRWPARAAAAPRPSNRRRGTARCRLIRDRDEREGLGRGEPAKVAHAFGAATVCIEAGLGGAQGALEPMLLAPQAIAEPHAAILGHRSHEPGGELRDARGGGAIGKGADEGNREEGHGDHGNREPGAERHHGRRPSGTAGRPLAPPRGVGANSGCGCRVGMVHDRG